MSEKSLSRGFQETRIKCEKMAIFEEVERFKVWVALNAKSLRL